MALRRNVNSVKGRRAGGFLGSEGPVGLFSAYLVDDAEKKKEAVHEGLSGIID